MSMTPNFIKKHEYIRNDLQQNIENIIDKGTSEDLEEIFKGLNTLKNLFRS